MTLEEHLRAALTNRAAIPALCHVLIGSEIIVLGRTGGDDQRGGEAPLGVLHYRSAGEQVMPIFTHSQYVEIAAKEDPACAGLEAIPVQGRYLLEQVGDDVLLLVNPWSDVEVELHSRAVRAAVIPGTDPAPQN
jgi:hypothetical protein